MSNQVVFCSSLERSRKHLQKNRRKKKRPRLLLPEALLHDKGVFIAMMTSLNIASIAKMRQWLCLSENNQKKHNLIFR
ncbi:hypothetical protein C9183_03405 [Escherichia coli]|nr:hypothetical protein C9198_25535 [Escherichia coli]TJG19725.1 hypothetical protein C9183_03405 [Escherichia coli]TJG39248.1 hypothetical protein C9174_25010 [Escherichia coli]